MIGLVTVQNKPQQISKMKKFIILLSLIATTILLTSCGAATNFKGLYDDKYGDDWFTSNAK